MDDQNPYAAPRTNVEPERVAPRLWNPNAIGLWSLLLSPVFGSVLVNLNWRAMGERKRANAELFWVAASFVSLVVAILHYPALNVLFLLIWYFGSQSIQARHIKRLWDDEYPRRGWLVPIGLGFLFTFSLGFGLSALQLV